MIRARKREMKEKAVSDKKKASKSALQKQVQSARLALVTRFKYDVKALKDVQLKGLWRWKKKKGDPPMPTKKTKLLFRYRQSKNNYSPNVSPSNSEAEQLSDDDSYREVSDSEVENESEVENSDIESDAEE